MRDDGRALYSVVVAVCRTVLLTSAISSPAVAQAHGHAIDVTSVRLDTSSPQDDATPAVWFADHHAAKRIAVASDQIDRIIPLTREAAALAVDPRDRSLWVLTHKHLLKFDAQTSQILDVDLRTLTRTSDKDNNGEDSKEEKGNYFDVIDDAEGIAVNPYDGSVWIHAKKTLIHVDRDANFLFAWRSPGQIYDFSLSLDESLWLLTDKRLVHLSSQGAEIRSLALADHNLGHLRHLAHDAFAGILWLSSEHALYHLTLSNPPTNPPNLFHLSSQERDAEEEYKDGEDGDSDGHAIHDLALDPMTGTLWVAGKHSLSSFDRDGTELATVDLVSQSIHHIDALAFDSSTRSLWVGGKKAIVHLLTGGAVVANIRVDDELEALGVSPLMLTPRLTLLQPAPDIVTNNARLPIRLGLGALCQGAPCERSEPYLNALTLDVTLDGQALGSHFSRSPNEASYTPQDRYAEGIHAFAAQAHDPFGHDSNAVSGRFTVDTIPPRFLDLSPADGSTVSTPEVNLEGSLDDADATITLENLISLGASVISDDPSRFRFQVPLKPGLNSFTVIANDRAGNESRRSLQITLSSLSVKVSNLDSGAVVNTDRLLIRGNFEGPPNTGITVNGQIAQTYGNEFFANNVPLHPGENTLSIIATTLKGETAAQRIIVFSAAPAVAVVNRAPSARTNMTTIAGTGDYGFSGDGGFAVNAHLAYPESIAVGPDGSIYLAQPFDDRVRRITPDGIITTVAGAGVSGFSGDGGLAVRAKLRFPLGVAVDVSGNLYIADTWNYRIRRVTPDGIISTVAGNGQSGFSGDGGLAAQAKLGYPVKVAIGANNLYIVDSGNARVRQVAPNGVISTVAGNGQWGFSGDGGPATSATLGDVADIAAADDGSLYLTDNGNRRVRRVGQDGTITTVAGSGALGSALGDGGPATSASITASGIAIRADGGFYISGGHRVRYVNANGIITTVAGTGVSGYDGDDGAATLAQLASPRGMAIGPDSTVYVADTVNQRIRAFSTLNASGDFPPLLAGFKLSAPVRSAIQRVDVDFDGDGVLDASTTNIEATLDNHYTDPGAHIAKFYVTDVDGQVHTLEYAVVLSHIAQTDVLLRGIYTEFLASLKTGSIDAALKTFTAGVYEKYKAIFTSLQPDLPQIVDQLGELQEGIVGEEMAEYVLVRNVNGTKSAFIFYFLKSEDGVWRIDGM